MVNEKINLRLPVEDLAKVGLYTEDKLALGKEDQAELLAGRRTGLVDLKNLEHEGIKIQAMKAKLSLRMNSDQTTTLIINPIYKERQKHPLLSDKEMDRLESGKKDNIVKSYINRDGEKRKELIEFDPETKQFVSLDPDNLYLIEAVNNQRLTDEQKRKFKNGERVDLDDGSSFQASPTSKGAIKSQIPFLIFSVLIDGGISYLLVNGGKALIGRDKKNNTEYSKGFQDAYDAALKEMEANKFKNKTSKFINFPDDLHKQDLDELKRERQANKYNNQLDRKYTRSGGSR